VSLADFYALATTVAIRNAVQEPIQWISVSAEKSFRTIFRLKFFGDKFFSLNFFGTNFSP
jgi:hypothetical protein